MPDAPSVVLRLEGVTKRFGPLVANDGIDLVLHDGEVLALLGENGAGKTTLMNILFGHYVADEGAMTVFGEPLRPGSPREAIAAGIGMVHQHFTLGDDLTVLDNVMLGTESLFAFRQGVAEARDRLAALADRFGLAVHPDRRIADLSVGERQRVEILKALYRDARILVLDEPTAVLTPQEAESLFATLKLMVAGGLSVIFISHKLNEVMAIADRVAVLRRGRVVFECETAATTKEDLATAMVGRVLEPPKREAAHRDAPALSLSGVSVAGPDGEALLDAVDLEVRRGEIVGIAGVSGNGQAALADLVGGLVAPTAGAFEVLGEAVTVSGPAAMIDRGVARVPEDRHEDGIIAEMSVKENLILESYDAPGFCRHGFLKAHAILENARAKIAGFDVRGAGPETQIRSLSGGNIQKVILARVLSSAPEIILANQPTRGLDVGAASYVHEKLFEARAGGAGVLVISEDLDELLQVCDRLAVIHDGRLSREMPVEGLTPTALGLLMSGHGDAH